MKISSKISSKKSLQDCNSHLTSVQDKREHPLINIFFNIFLPVIVLKQGHRLGENGPWIALFIALAIPLVYGLRDWIQRKEKNMIALLGFVNVGFTGVLVVLRLDGLWFALKEAFFPFILGVGVWISGASAKPFVQKLLWQPNFLNLPLINERLMAGGHQNQVDSLLRRINFWFAISFFVSSALNFLLGLKIFLPLDQTLSQMDRDLVLNNQVAEMTWQGYIVIALPLTAMMFLIMWYFLKQLRQITHLTLDDMLVAKPTNHSPSSGSTSSR